MRRAVPAERSPDVAVAVPAAPALALVGLAQRFGERTVLTIDHWQVPAGDHSLILGPSGSGKSTLLHLIAGLLRPTRGQILVAGQDLHGLSASARDRFRGRQIGIVLQNLHLIGALSVLDNLQLARSLAGLPRDPDWVERLVEELGLAPLRHARPEVLSHGERQRVAIARAVVNRPTLVLADEPTSALDDANCTSVLELLRTQAARSGATLVIATHDGRVKRAFAHRLDLGSGP